jgi:hypothetical protein
MGEDLRAIESDPIEGRVREGVAVHQPHPGLVYALTRGSRTTFG